MPAIHVQSFILGSYPIRGFLAWAEGDREAIFVDPGGWDNAILEALADNGLTVRAIVLTHGHWDHTGGLDEMVAHLRASVYIHAEDTRLLKSMADVVLEGGEQIHCGSLDWHVLNVPGHTAGSIALSAGDVLFTGDTLFAGSIGGTPNHVEYERERAGIRTRLFPLGDAVRVYPAHGPATSLGVERRCNPFLR